MSIFSRAILPLLTLCCFLTQCSMQGPPRCEQIPFFARKDPENYLAKAETAWKILANPRKKHLWPDAQTSYNDAISRLYAQLRCQSKTTRNYPTIAASLGTTIAPTTSPDQARLPDIQNLFPAKLAKLGGLQHYTQPGIGLPLVGWTPNTPLGKSRKTFDLPTGQPYTVTALLRFDRGKTPTWEFYAPSQNPNTTLAQRTIPLAADWTAPLAFYWSQCAIANFTVQKVLFPSRFTNEIGLYFTQTYDPKKIPLVFVHGVNSSPKTFLTMINSLNSLPWFREKYQIWLFNYPTGADWLTTSREFRKAMNQARDYALAHGGQHTLYQTTIIAHSMGGLVTRASLSQPNSAFYDSLFSVPINQLKTTPREREKLARDLFYQPLDFPARAIFLAVPHQGSPMAERAIFNYLSNLITLPKELTIGTLDFFLRNTQNILLPSQDKIPTGINTLTTNAPIIRGLQKTQFPTTIAAYSIIGNFWHANQPGGSDLVVPYWSSHIPFARSETIVQSSHSITENTQAILQVANIIQKPTPPRPTPQTTPTKKPSTAPPKP